MDRELRLARVLSALAYSGLILALPPSWARRVIDTADRLAADIVGLCLDAFTAEPIEDVA